MDLAPQGYNIYKNRPNPIQLEIFINEPPF